MARGENQKFKLYRLAEIMLDNTDEDHYITMPEIIEKLAVYDITAERKSLYQDLRDLEKLGIEVEGETVGNRYHYHVVSRDFELPELKLLVDAIQSSKFITEKKSNNLIKKLERLVSKYDAQKLQRQVYVSGRIKTMNESIYYAVDTIHHAISENKKILFQYFQWNVKKEMELRHDGAWYQVSPWGLSWDDENYYLVGYDAEAGQIKHYRVDKMLSISMCEECREGKEYFKKLDMADYAKKSFGMFGGKEQKVKLLVHNSMAGVIIDRFGKDVMMIPTDQEYFTVNVEVHVSRQFLGWVFSLGEKAKIVGPEDVVNQMKKEVARLKRQYIDDAEHSDQAGYLDQADKKPNELQKLSRKELEELAERACSVIPQKVQYYAEIMQVRYGRITIRNQRTRWGSCSGKGNLNFNCLLMLAPEVVLEYVVVHELCHLIEMNHSNAFWAQVEHVMPDYRIHRQWLKEHGHEIMGRMF